MMTAILRTLSILPLMLFVCGYSNAASTSSDTISGLDAPLLRPLGSAQSTAPGMKPETFAADLQNKVAEAPVMSDSWAMILEKYVKSPDGTGLARFDYGALHANAQDRAALDDYIASLEATDTESLAKSEATAFWANLYNAVTIKVVIDNYPVKSIRKIKSGFRAGPWKRDLVTVGGNDLSLDDIEHKILRKKYPSPLVHYMVNCASIGCPNLSAAPWQAGTLDADREAAARAFINSPRGAKVTEKGLVVSSIYDWFEEDFGGSKAGVLAHLSQYAEGNLKAAIDAGIDISDYDYNWSLNE